MIGLDTNAIIDIFKGKEELEGVLKRIKSPLCATDITYLELMFGLDFTNKKHKNEEYYYDEFFKTINTLRLNEKACKLSSEIFYDLKKKGKEIGQLDCTIAAILIINGVDTLITRNVKHFKNISRLKVIGY